MVYKVFFFSCFVAIAVANEAMDLKHRALEKVEQMDYVPYTSFNPGQPWFDTSGKLIRAHSGGLLHDTNSNTTFW